MKLLLLTPPLTQLNTPYPATAVLKGFLEAHGHTVAQADLGIELVDRIYTREWLAACAQSLPAAEQEYLLRCADCVEPVMRFLRGQESTLVPRIANRSLLPEGPRFGQLADTEWAFGIAGTEDKARYLATLFVEDIADCLREHVDPHFDLVRYAEQLASYAPAFDEMEQALQAPLTVIDTLMLDLLDQHLQSEQPDLVGLAVPFPGCLYAALRCGQHIKEGSKLTSGSSSFKTQNSKFEVQDIGSKLSSGSSAFKTQNSKFEVQDLGSKLSAGPSAFNIQHSKFKISPKVVIGGGFPNTEWRQLSEPRIFDYCDYITFDDGEEPLLRIANGEPLVRTLTSSQLQVTSSNLSAGSSTFNIQHSTSDFSGLPLEKYIPLAEMANPMHRLWSCGRWNKMMMAHGCYWHRCAFCDTTLDYIGRYDAPSAASVVDRMEHVMAQTGICGFHFVDEALPPKLLGEVCQEILRRRLVVSFWGNIRFEKAYTAELCDLMADAGCVAVSGGLEVASDRLLRLMDKGVTIEQTVQACRHFRQAGIMVHTYLMYGFPTETLQETLDALETVRRMFDEGIVQSAFWHRYAMTCHSPSGQHPERFGARCTDTQPHPFCNNEVDWLPVGSDTQFDYDIEEVGRGLRMATFNYMNGLGFDQPLRTWFPGIKTRPQPLPKGRGVGRKRHSGSK